jgi:hypothetical protein
MAWRLFLAIVHEFEPCTNPLFTNKPDARTIVLELGREIQWGNVLRLDAIRKRPQRRAYLETDGHDRRSVLRDPGCPLLLEGLPDLGMRGHKKTRFCAVLPGKPLAAMTDNLAVRNVVDSLTEVPDVSLLVLSVIVERVLDELTILVLLDVDDRDRNLRDAVSSLENPRLDAYFRPKNEKPSLGPFERSDRNRREGDERVIDLR